ncbi:MAG: DNA cytosine methyltransferase [Collinsella sp.]
MPTSGTHTVVEWRVVNSAEYGFPQRRKRVFGIFCEKERWQRLSDPAVIACNNGVMAESLPPPSDLSRSRCPEFDRPALDPR